MSDTPTCICTHTCMYTHEHIYTQKHTQTSCPSLQQNAWQSLVALNQLRTWKEYPERWQKDHTLCKVVLFEIQCHLSFQKQNEQFPLLALSLTFQATSSLCPPWLNTPRNNNDLFWLFVWYHSLRELLSLYCQSHCPRRKCHRNAISHAACHSRRWEIVDITGMSLSLPLPSWALAYHRDSVNALVEIPDLGDSSEFLSQTPLMPLQMGGLCSRST